MEKGTLGNRLACLTSEIALASKQSHRDGTEIKLVAVTKTLPIEAITNVYDLGIYDIGENKVQELLEKYDQLKHLNINWHFIGHLQTNKVKYVVDKVSLIHSVDSFKLAKEISKECVKKNICVNILIQFNVVGEDSKYGFAPEEAIKIVEKISLLNNLKIKGLMTMAPFVENPEETRRCFRGLTTLANLIREANIPNVEMQELSMGMSNDFQVAIEEGATIIRLGTGLFGERQY
ncbi:MAG: YggS family pyridoxal phosphate-dependent enzyme [Bacillota bacterium]|nr:YggS family pyridoxal phosphate-dependent enzyme [Bacillota bacterium]